MNGNALCAVIAIALVVMLAYRLRRNLFVKYAPNNVFTSHEMERWPERREHAIFLLHLFAVSLGICLYLLCYLALSELKLIEERLLLGFAAATTSTLLLIYPMHRVVKAVRNRIQAINKLHTGYLEINSLNRPDLV